MPDKLAQFVKKELAGKKLIVVSNREPYVHKKTGLSIKVEKSAGGLTSAMDDVLKATGGTWVAWGSGNGDTEVVDSHNRVAVPPESPLYSLKRVWLAPSEVDNYYHGYSNQVLWPLCHIALDRVYFRKKFWVDYVNVNQAFAQAVLEEANGDTAVWIHDYHLCLAPRFIREKTPDLAVAHFWHIPWPDWSVFRICPQGRDVLEGLLGSDMIGFQIPLFVRNFLDCVKQCLNADIDYNKSTITYNGQVTTLKVFPISIDFANFDAMASSSRTVSAMEDIRKRHALPALVGIGVDRLEYTKALIKRLQAISLFFERYQKMRGRFTFIQIAVPTRLKEPYLSYQETVQKMIADINAKYGTKTWKPIVYIDTKIEHRDLVAYYRLADVAVISSIYDGMNLVAKEYAASQVNGKGALILSELAGAADELDGAILVNPYDIEEFSLSLKRALELPAAEKERLMAGLREQVRENDIYKWIRDILEELMNLSNRKRNQAVPFFGRGREIRKALHGGEIFLFLDYDGTLAPIAESPEQAVMSRETRELVARLADAIPVAVVSGRNVEDVQQRIGIEGIIFAGNHGAEIRHKGETLVSQQSPRERRILEEFLHRLRSALASIPGVLVEDKGITASVHYRLVDLKKLADFSAQFTGIARAYEKKFRITSGKKVFEIRPLKAWNKGDAVSWILEHRGAGKIPVYIGDDITDEDAFKSLKGRGVSIAVGGSAFADLYVEKQGQVAGVLEELLAIAGGKSKDAPESLESRGSKDVAAVPGNAGCESSRHGRIFEE
jgi:alpha,alpha-trehalose-phosphate synthase [UDP-forming]/trehalose-phosphatase